MGYLIIDERMRNVEKEKLKKLGYNLIEIRKNNVAYPEISSHVDIFTCKVNDKIIVENSQYDNIKKQLGYSNLISKIEIGNLNIEKNYPYDIRYNVCIVGNMAIHNFKYTDTKLYNELKNNDFELINVKQGYTNCSIAVIDENSIILSDKGLYKSLKNKGIDILFLDEVPNIKLFYEKGKYSNKNGFIGGAISRIENNVIVHGDLNRIDIDGRIRKFIENKNLNIIDFENLDVIDYGGVIYF